MKSIWDTRFSTSKARTFSEALERAGFALDGWVTMNGSRVLLGEAGEILGGLGGAHNGENVKDLKKSDKEEKPAQPTTAVEKPVLSSNRAEAERQTRQYIESLYLQRVANGERADIESLRNTGKDKEAVAATCQLIEDLAVDRVAIDKEYLQQNISPIEPGELSGSLTTEQKVRQVGRLDDSGACASLMVSYLAVDKLGLDVYDRVKGAENGGDLARAKDAVNTVAMMSQGLIKKAGGDVRVFADKENKSIDAALSLLKDMKPDKEYVFSAAVTGTLGHVTITRRIGDDENPRYQYLELQRHDANWRLAPLFPTWCNGWQELTPESMAERFQLKPTTKSPVVVSMIEATKLANSKDFQDLIPYVNGKPKQSG